MTLEYLHDIIFVQDTREQAVRKLDEISACIAVGPVVKKEYSWYHYVAGTTFLVLYP
jgi:hypothetical protein